MSLKRYVICIAALLSGAHQTAIASAPNYATIKSWGLTPLIFTIDF